MLEWNLIYVGSSDSAQYDQIIDSVEVGPIPPGNHEFQFETENSVDPSKIQDGHLLGPTDSSPKILHLFIYSEKMYIT